MYAYRPELQIGFGLLEPEVLLDILVQLFNLLGCETLRGMSDVEEA